MSYDQTLYDFRLAIAEWLKYAVGHDRVFYARTNFTRPKTQYLTYRIATVTPDELPSYVGFDDSGLEIVDLNHHISVDIKCYRDEFSDSFIKTPQSVLNSVVHSINKKEIYYKYLDLKCIGHLDSSTVSDRSIPLDGHEWEQRAMVLMNFHIVIRELDEGTELTSSVEEVILAQTQNDAGGNQIIQDDIIGPIPSP